MVGCHLLQFLKPSLTAQACKVEVRYAKASTYIQAAEVGDAWMTFWNCAARARVNSDIPEAVRPLVGEQATGRLKQFYRALGR